MKQSLDDLPNHLRRIDQKLYLEVRKARQGDRNATDDRFRGLYVSDGQIDAILGATSASGDTADGDSLQERLPSRLAELAELFGLSGFETDVLFLCFLPDLEMKYQKLYAYMQDDITKKRPTVETVIRLQSEGAADEIGLRQVFHASRPLFRDHLVRFVDDRLSSSVPLLARQLEIDERISAYLLGLDQMDSRLLPCVRRIRTSTKLPNTIIADETRERLSALVVRFGHKPFVLHLRGPGRSSVAEALCGELETPLLVLETGRVAEDTTLESLLPLFFREGKLQRAVLYLECDSLLASSKDPGLALPILEEGIATYTGWVILSGDRDWQPSRIGWKKPFVSIELPMPSYSLRHQAWQSHGREFHFSADVDLADLAGRFRLSTGQVGDAIVAARDLALWRCPRDNTITANDIEAACRKLTRPGLNAVAQKITSNYAWQDIVLPREQLEHLREICSYVKYHETVYGEWGFGRKHSRGRGLNALFAGPSGTGKTMAAEIMAGELGFDLYKIDLSTIVSKYIGETEKNLDRIFREAQLSNAILFFDEADALFGKRSEVRDAHDRYANIEVAYLLQKMEDYDGVVILATNLRKNMDEAFARRMHFTVEFPMPDEGDRLKIWQGVFPAEAPVSKDAELNFMARQFKISGGNIKNIALNAAFLAAQDGKVITIEHLVRSTKREYQKMGKLCTEGDFAQYYEIVRGQTGE